MSIERRIMDSASVLENGCGKCCGYDIFRAVGGDWISNGCVICLRRLLERNQEEPDIKQRDHYQWAPLHFAAVTNNLVHAKILIENGASVDIKDREGKTPLHVSAIHDNGEIARFLIEHGADVDAKISVSNRTFLECFHNKELIAEFEKIVDEMRAFEIKVPDCE